MDRKTCARCGTARVAADFPRNQRMKDGLDSWCKPCRAEYARQYHWRRKGVDVTPPKVRKSSLVVRAADGTVTTKLCTDCGRMVVASGYSRNRASSTGLAAFCKPCQKAREDRARHEKAYGITVDQAEQLRRDQGGLCAVCDDGPAEHIDHDHASGVVRAWLCQRCNMGLGLFGESAERLRRAADYLDGHDPFTRAALERMRRRARYWFAGEGRGKRCKPCSGAAWRREIAPGLWRIVPLAELLETTA